MIQCRACSVELPYSGRGRRPQYCKPHGAVVARAQVAARQRRRKALQGHMVASKWGAYAVPGERPVKRDPRQVWGRDLYGDGTVTYSAGAFAPIGERGIQGDTFEIVTSEAVKAALRNFREMFPDWWRIETWAHESLSASVVDEIRVNAAGDHPGFKPNIPYRTDRVMPKRVFVVDSEGSVESPMSYYARWVAQNNKGGRA